MAFKDYTAGPIKDYAAENMPPEEAAATSGSGSSLFGKPPATDEKVPVVNPEGRLVKIPLAQYEEAKKQGYQDATEQQAKHFDTIRENEGVGGSIYSAMAGAVDSGSFGVIPQLHKYLDPAGFERLQAVVDDHKLSNYGGQATGLVLGTVATGGAGGFAGTAAKAGAAAERAGARALTSVAEKEIAAKLVAESGMTMAAAEKIARPAYKAIATGALKLGTEGAIFSAPAAITEAVLGDPAEAAETLAYGFGGGAILGAAGAAGSKLIQLSQDALKLGTEGSLANRLKSTIATELKEMPGKIEAKNAGALKSNVQKVGSERVNASYNRLADEGYLSTGMKSSEQVAANINRATEDGGSRMGNALEQLDARASELRVPAAEAAEAGKTSIIDDLLKMKSEVKNKATNEYKINILDDSISKLSNDLTDISKSETPFKDLHGLRMDMDHTLKYNAMGVPAEEEFKQEIRSKFNEKFTELIDDAAKKLDAPELAVDWKSGNQLYSDAAVWQKFLQNKENAKIGNNMFGLMDGIWGAAGVTSAVTGLAGAIADGDAEKAGYASLPLLALGGRKALTSSYGQTAIATAMRRIMNAGADKAGIALAAETMAHAEKQIGTIPKLLQNLNLKDSAKIGSMRAISSFLGKDGKKTETISERKKLALELSDKIRELGGDPEKTQAMLSQLAGPLTLGAPAVSEAYIQQKIKTLQYIQTILPKTSGTDDLNPFKTSRKSISDADLLNFEKQLDVINNPFNILKSLKNGTISQGQVDAVKNVYPVLYEKIKTKIVESAAEHKDKKMTYDNRMKLSLLLGTPLDDSLKHIQAYQATFTQQDEKQKGTNLKMVPAPKQNPYATPITKALSR